MDNITYDIFNIIKEYLKFSSLKNLKQTNKYYYDLIDDYDIVNKGGYSKKFKNYRYLYNFKNITGFDFLIFYNKENLKHNNKLYKKYILNENIKLLEIIKDSEITKIINNNKYVNYKIESYNKYVYEPVYKFIKNFKYNKNIYFKKVNYFSNIKENKYYKFYYNDDANKILNELYFIS